MNFLGLLLAVTGLVSTANAADRVVTQAVAQFWAYQHDGGVQYHTWQQGNQVYNGNAVQYAWNQMKSSPQHEMYGYSQRMCGSGTIREIRIQVNYVMAHQNYQGATMPNGNQRQDGRYGFTCYGYSANMTMNHESHIYFN